jgi:hypothetical protein
VVKRIPSISLLISTRVTAVIQTIPVLNILHFYILLTVNRIMILGQRPMWRTILYHVFIFIFNSLHISSTWCSSSGETNCVNTTSGNCHMIKNCASRWSFTKNQCLNSLWFAATGQ